MRFGDDSSLSREIIELLGEARSDIGDKAATIAKRKKLIIAKNPLKQNVMLMFVVTPFTLATKEIMMFFNHLAASRSAASF